MTSEEIRVDAQLLCGFQINEVTAFLWCKDAITYITRDHPLAAAKRTVHFDIDTDGEERQLDGELVRIELITKDNERRNVADRYVECDELGKVKFWHKGKYDITYRYVPDMPATVNENIPVPNRYAEPIKYYIAARQRARIYGQNDTEAQGYDALFWEYVNNADAAMLRTNKRYRQMPARY